MEEDCITTFVVIYTVVNLVRFIANNDHVEVYIEETSISHYTNAHVDDEFE